MRDIDPTASEYISSGYLKFSRPGGLLFDPVTATIASVGSSLLGSSMASDAAGDAADAQAASADKANALQKEMFDKQVELQEPFRQAGLTGQNRLMDLLGLSGNKQAQGYGSAMRNFGMSDFQADPGYQWRLQQGQQALERSAAARGGLLSGRAAKDMTNYAQGAASQEYGNAFNRFQTNRSNQLNPLQSLAGQAQTATNQIANDAGTYGARAGGLMVDSGKARASGYIGSSNAWTDGISGGIKAYQNQNAMNKLFPSGSQGFEPVYDSYGLNVGGYK